MSSLNGVSLLILLKIWYFMENVIVGGILAFFSTLCAIPVIIKVAQAKRLYDEPDDDRKIHLKPIPSLGGLAMFIGLTLCILLTINFSIAQEFQYYIAAFLVIFFIGIKDDIIAISPITKLIGQLIAGGILIFKGNLLITDMQGFLGVHHLETTLSYFLTLFVIILIINAFNLIDGVDGLAGTIGLVACSIFGIFFLLNNNMPYAILALGFAAAIVAFLVYNFHPAKIFMGDTGSLLLGLVSSILIIKFVETAGQLHPQPLVAVPAVGFSIILLPLMDTLRVFVFRVLKGTSPFRPDRNHIHHLLLDRGFNHGKVTLICTAFSALLICLAIFLQPIGTTWLIALLMGCFFMGIYCITRMKVKLGMRVIERKIFEEEVRERRRVSI